MYKRNEELIEEFLLFKVDVQAAAERTYIEYRKNLNSFAKFIELNFAYDLLSVKASDIVNYKRTLLHYRNQTINTYMAPIFAFYKWALWPTIAKIEKSPLPMMMHEKPSTIPNFIPTAKGILKVRKNVETLFEAVLFETLLSTGLRLGEFLQIRCCDINFSGTTKDYELQKISPFIGASMELNIHKGFKIKRNKRRIVFFSKLAANLLKLYIKELGLSSEANAPVFPIKRHVPSETLRRIARGVMLTNAAAKKNINIKDDKRLPSHGDINLSSADLINTSEEYKNKIRGLHAAENRHRQTMPSIVYDRVTRTERNRSCLLHPHALRHFFAMAQYYRNWYGNRHDIVALRELLGHSSSSSVIDTYTGPVQQPIIENDAEWKLVYLGNGIDYKRLTYAR